MIKTRQGFTFRQPGDDVYFFQTVLVNPGVIWRIGGIGVPQSTFILEWNTNDLTHRHMAITGLDTMTRKGFAFKVENGQGKEEVTFG